MERTGGLPGWGQQGAGTGRDNKATLSPGCRERRHNACTLSGQTPQLSLSAWGSSLRLPCRGTFLPGTRESHPQFSPLLPLRVGLSPGQGSINPQPPGFRLLFPGSPGLPPWLPRHCRALALPPAQGLAPVGGDWGLPQRCSVQPGCALPRLLPLAAASGWDCKPAGHPPPSASTSPSPAQAQRPQPLLSSLCWRTGNGPSLAGVRRGLQDSAPRRRPRSLSGCRLMPIPAAWGESSEPISPSQPGTDPRKELGLPFYGKGAQPRHGSVLSWEEPPARVPLSLTLC